MSYIRADVAPGIKKAADLIKAQRFKAGGLSNDSFKDVAFRLSFDLLGLQYDYVTGYNSSADARLAVQRNEVQYHDETLPGYRSQVEPGMVKPGLVTPLYYADLIDADGGVADSPDVPELPSFTKFYTQVLGKPPSGIKIRSVESGRHRGNQHDPGDVAAAGLAEGSDSCAETGGRVALEGRRISRRGGKSDALPTEV